MTPASGISLSGAQSDAVKRTVEWFKNCAAEIAEKKPLTQQVWRLFGFAGVGKSTVLKFILDEIRTTGDRMILSGAFTGKAALVMTRKGTPAQTIHSMIYKVTEPGQAAIEEAKEVLAKLKSAPPKDPAAMLLWRAQIRDRELQIRNMHKPIFIINEDSLVVDADLIVLDEVSMVNDDMAADLMSFNKPILVLGDPGQLPPIKGEGAFTNATPDILLTEIHRQASDSAIIRLATMARNGEPIPFGKHSDLVWKVRRKDCPLEWLSRSDQVLCGYNATRFMLNNEMRKAAGFSGALPSEGAKTICLRNINSEGLINGMFLNLSNIKHPTDHSFGADIQTEDGVKVGHKTVYRGHYDDHIDFDKDRGQKEYFLRKGKVECVWGYAITVHKSQGSAFSNVVFYDDGFGRGEDRARLCYTAITRAETGLLIVAQ